MSDPIRVPKQVEAPVTQLAYVWGAEIVTVWPQVYEMVAKACDETITTREIYDAVAGGKALLWLVIEGGEVIACAVTHRREKAGNAWLDVTTIGGEGWDRWAQDLLQPAFEEYARQVGVDAIVAHVRRGMVKWLKNLGWKERQVHMEYRIDG